MQERGKKYSLQYIYCNKKFNKHVEYARCSPVGAVHRGGMDGTHFEPYRREGVHPMSKLTVNTFIAGDHDAETRQYHVLQSLKDYQGTFSHNYLYPSLSELIDLCTALESLLESKGNIENHLPQRLTEIDLVNQKLVYEAEHTNTPDFERVVELIEWALPKIRRVIEEGIDIYNLVDDHISIEEIGIMPMYREEGYWFVPNLTCSRLDLYRYEVSLFTAASERFRTLKTRLLDSLEQEGIMRSPEQIKLELVHKYRELPNPATYMCETDLDFPYDHTMLPVARRKLMKHLFS
jgi:hypothetical protein